ncbi:hypothetical protein TRFO_18026 [Tritrichomonas foetus]|uniref:Uncharacterized protein n=1 Tax=Tritrichomonas foetus TaxID=1144522 RepID=A0A1J4KLP9_9EUKA|nr:hypothetical protein TRFO_18026 [Tritrichomonas foetus]|eukprot:OHT12225.1 hypothetical protein TRFO_18026 [Tritrichomonas foetus]
MNGDQSEQGHQFSPRNLQDKSLFQFKAINYQASFEAKQIDFMHLHSEMKMLNMKKPLYRFVSKPNSVNEIIKPFNENIIPLTNENKPKYDRNFGLIDCIKSRYPNIIDADNEDQIVQYFCMSTFPSLFGHFTGKEFISSAFRFLEFFYFDPIIGELVKSYLMHAFYFRNRLFSYLLDVLIMEIDPNNQEPNIEKDADGENDIDDTKERVNAKKSYYQIFLDVLEFSISFLCREHIKILKKIWKDKAVGAIKSFLKETVSLYLNSPIINQSRILSNAINSIIKGIDSSNNELFDIFINTETQFFYEPPPVYQIIYKEGINISISVADSIMIKCITDELTLHANTDTNPSYNNNTNKLSNNNQLKINTNEISKKEFSKLFFQLYSDVKFYYNHANCLKYQPNDANDKQQEMKERNEFLIKLSNSTKGVKDLEIYKDCVNETLKLKIREFIKLININPEEFLSYQLSGFVIPIMKIFTRNRKNITPEIQKHMKIEIRQKVGNSLKTCSFYKTVNEVALKALLDVLAKHNVKNLTTGKYTEQNLLLCDFVGNIAFELFLKCQNIENPTKLKLHGSKDERINWLTKFVDINIPYQVKDRMVDITLLRETFRNLLKMIEFLNIDMKEEFDNQNLRFQGSRILLFNEISKMIYNSFRKCEIIGHLTFKSMFNIENKNILYFLGFFLDACFNVDSYFEHKYWIYPSILQNVCYNFKKMIQMYQFEETPSLPPS